MSPVLRKTRRNSRWEMKILCIWHFLSPRKKTIVLGNDNKTKMETWCQGAAMAKLSLGQTAPSIMHHHHFLVFLNSQMPTPFLGHPNHRSTKKHRWLHPPPSSQPWLVCRSPNDSSEPARSFLGDGDCTIWKPGRLHCGRNWDVAWARSG